MLKWAFLVCAALFLGALYKDGALPEPGELRLEIAREPLQEPISSPHIKTRVGGVDYTIEPSHLYDIYGLVVSKHNADTWWDWVHAASNDHLNVTDLCVVWGSNATSGAYRDIAFSSGQWTCNFQTNSDAAFKAFDITKISNNHLLTDKPSLAKNFARCVWVTKSTSRASWPPTGISRAWIFSGVPARPGWIPATAHVKQFLQATSASSPRHPPNGADLHGRAAWACCCARWQGSSCPTASAANLV